MRRLEGILIRWTLAALFVVATGLPLQAADFDLSVFGGVQRQGKLTLQSAPSTTANLIRTINATNFGMFGVRFSHGGVFGGEHTLAFAPNFIAADTKAYFYNSNIRIQAPLPVVRPYRTIGYPVVPIVFIMVAVWLIANTLQTNLKSAGAGLVLIALGLPLYYYFSRRSPRIANE